MARGTPALMPTLAVGAVLAGSVTFLRILVLASAFSRPLAAALAIPMAASAATGLAGALALYLTRGGRDGASPALPEMTNPLALPTALKFGALLALVVLATHYFQVWFGTAGVYAVAALSGITDVDAVTVSMARMTGTALTPEAAAVAAFVAVSVNNAVKAGIALAVGGRRFGFRVAAVYAAVVAVGAVAVWLR
jgi:uncharacterized membrane protein (DUF4010 family)